LVKRAEELNLNNPLYYALTYTQAILGTPVPDDAIMNIGKGAPKGLTAKLMNALYMQALMPYHASCDSLFSGAARWLLFVRSHYNRMPLYLLIPHIIKKAMKRKKAIHE
jgi:hypothetical protein